MQGRLRELVGQMRCLQKLLLKTVQFPDVLHQRRGKLVCTACGGIQTSLTVFYCEAHLENS